MSSVPEVKKQACEDAAWHRKQKKPSNFVKRREKHCRCAKRENCSNDSAADWNAIDSDLRMAPCLVIQKWGPARVAEDGCDQHSYQQGWKHDPPDEGFRDQHEHDYEEHDDDPDWTVHSAHTAQEAGSLHILILRVALSPVLHNFGHIRNCREIAIAQVDHWSIRAIACSSITAGSEPHRSDGDQCPRAPASAW